MTEETRPGFLANYKIVRPGQVSAQPGPPGRAGPQFKKSALARPAFGPARLTPLVYTIGHRQAVFQPDDEKQP